MVFTASLFCVQHKRDSVENKPATSLVLSSVEALNGMPPLLCGRQLPLPSSLSVVVAQSNSRLAKSANEKHII